MRNRKQSIPFFTTLLLTILTLSASANEGMWIPLLLGKQVYGEMVKEGLKLKADQIYSINHASLKDAVIIFGAGCTGEIVSSEGLVFTNHHCGFGAIATASTEQNNYLENGFWAYSKDQEIPAKDLVVKQLTRITDMTEAVNKLLGNATGQKRQSLLAKIKDSLETRATNKNEFKAAVLSSMFKDNQFFLYEYVVYKDIRLVGTPPLSMGKFGGDADNWEWPRQTCDFSMFRIYVSPSGNPALYSKNNVPYKPKMFLKINDNGIDNNEFAMILGFPATTDRYESSYGTKLAIDINDPTLVALRAIRLHLMLVQMQKNPATKLKLADYYSKVANYWKYFDGEATDLVKGHVVGIKQKQEAEFQKWADNKPVYKNIFSDLDRVYQNWIPYATSKVYIREGVFGSPLLALAASFKDIYTKLKNKDTTNLAKMLDDFNKNRTQFVTHEDVVSDQEIVGVMLKKFNQDIPQQQQPTAFYKSLLMTFSKSPNPYASEAQVIFSKTILLGQWNKDWLAFMRAPNFTAIANDPAIQVALAFLNNYDAVIKHHYDSFVSQKDDIARLYLKGLFEMEPAKMAMTYPDANFTMRLTYGQVRGYAPKDGLHADYYTTIDGAIAKYIPHDYQFNLPASFIDLYNKHDYGTYEDPIKHTLIVNFLTNNDITGGNSGSPIIDANGNLIGLAFDGNYESLAQKIFFNPRFARTICLDVRYLLWTVDKIGGAKNIISELTFVKNAKSK